MIEPDQSIFREYFEKKPFSDRFESNPDGAVDVIVPIIHTNELWEANLLSFYREVPIRALLIGDGGCIDSSIDIAKRFPRVQVLDHRNFVSLGYSLRKLIEAVETEWFIYLHSDVYLPTGWFDSMRRHQPEFDWFGCSMQHTVMVEYDNPYGDRPWAGSQMGRRTVFASGVKSIDDDYVYRQEDFVLADIATRAGGKEGKVADTFHYHQTIRKASPWGRKIKSVQLELEMARDEEVRTWLTQFKGIIKYLQPDQPWVVHEAALSLHRLIELGEATQSEFEQWTRMTNPSWIPHLRKGLLKFRLRKGFSVLEQFLRRTFFKAGR